MSIARKTSRPLSRPHTSKPFDPSLSTSTWVSPLSVLEEVADLVRDRVKPGTQLSIRRHPEVPRTVQCDRRLLRRVLLDLFCHVADRGGEAEIVASIGVCGSCLEYRLTRPGVEDRVAALDLFVASRLAHRLGGDLDTCGTPEHPELRLRLPLEPDGWMPRPAYH